MVHQRVGDVAEIRDSDPVQLQLGTPLLGVGVNAVLG
jgi:hypothetical protein